MPRYFFETSGAAPHADREGRDLANDRAAWSLAISSTGELLRDLDGELPDHAEIRMTVTNDRGRALIILDFSARWIGAP